jgi:hypothetical protein
MARSSFTRSPAAAVARLGHGFVAGFLATLLFHQTGLALLHGAGLAGDTAFSMQPVPPFGMPALVQLAFWGGVWGIAFALVERPIGRCPGGYWLGALLFGAVVPTLVFWFVVLPLKGLPVGYGVRFRGVVATLIVDGLWGLGTAMFLRMRPGSR